nr:unnamed protein product [Callosobruchus chinensis]
MDWTFRHYLVAR